SSAVVRRGGIEPAGDRREDLGRAPEGERLAGRGGLRVCRRPARGAEPDLAVGHESAWGRRAGEIRYEVHDLSALTDEPPHHQISPAARVAEHELRGGDRIG